MLDLSNAKSNTNEVLPAGKYVCNVTNAELKDTKNGTGQYIKAELTIIDSANKGRKVWTNFNVKNSNAQAVEIGLGQLKSLLENAGYANPNKLESVTDLCGLTVGVKTKIKSDEYGEKAEVGYFFKASKETAAPSSEEIAF